MIKTASERGAKSMYRRLEAAREAAEVVKRSLEEFSATAFLEDIHAAMTYFEEKYDFVDIWVVPPYVDDDRKTITIPTASFPCQQVDRFLPKCAIYVSDTVAKNFGTVYEQSIKKPLTALGYKTSIFKSTEQHYCLQLSWNLLGHVLTAAPMALH